MTRAKLAEIPLIAPLLGPELVAIDLNHFRNLVLTNFTHFLSLFCSAAALLFPEIPCLPYSRKYKRGRLPANREGILSAPAKILEPLVRIPGLLRLADLHHTTS